MRDRSPALFYIAFFVTGFATVLTANLLPLVIGSGGDAHAGRLLALQFSGQLVGALCVRRHVARTMCLGLATTAVCACVLALPSPLHWAALFPYGCGLGVSMTAINVLAAQDLAPAQRTSRLEALNVFWPLGAAICPWVVNRLPMQNRGGRPFAAIAIAFALLLLWAWLRAGNAVTQRFVQQPRKAWSPQLIRTALLGLFAVGAETGLANFMPTFQARYLSEQALLIPLATLFWGGILLSRAVASAMARYPAMRAYHRHVFSGAVIAVPLLVLSHSRVELSALCFLCAICLGPIYPEVLTEAVRLPWPGPIFFSAGVGSALIPWAIGQISGATGSLRVGLLMVDICCVMLFALSYRSERKGAFETCE